LSGPDGHWYAEEDAALHELPLIARLIYLQGLRRFMCGRTFRVGEPGRRTVTYRSLAETVTVPAVRGRHSGDETTPSEKTIRHALDVLVESGLLQRVPGFQGRLVFRCAIAAQCHQVRRMRGGSGAGSGAPMRGGEESSSDAGFEPMRGGMRGTPDAPMRGAQQRTDNSYSVVEPEGEGESSRVAPTVAGALCARLRALGVGRLSTAHPRLLQALAMGITSEEFEECVRKRVEAGHDPPSLPWLAEAVIGKRQDRQRQLAHGTEAGSAGQRQSSSERAEAALRHGDALARERVAGHLRLIAGGRAATGDPAGAVDADGWDLSPPLDVGHGDHA
jgi:hypothetical protein